MERGVEQSSEGRAIRLYFTNNLSDPFPDEALRPSEGGWVPEPAGLGARPARGPGGGP